jgi:homoserine dehydrogenase
MAKYYLRLSVVDQPGVLAQIAQILGDWSISIASVLQIDSDPSEQTAEIVITTHPAVEASVQSSLKLMSDLEVVRKVNNLLRIEE